MEEKKTSIIHYALVACCCLSFRYIPPIGQMTPMGMGILGCFIGAVYGWSTINMIWPSIMAMVGTGLCIGMANMAYMTFGNNIIVCMLFIFPALGIMSSTGAMDYLVNKILTNHSTLGKPWLTVFVLLMACAFFKTICKRVGIAPYTKLPVFLFLGIAYTGMLGQVMIPFMGQGMALIGAYAGTAGAYPNFARYMLFAVPLTILMTAIYVVLMRFVFRVDVSPFKNMTEDMLGERVRCTRDQKKAILVFSIWILTILCSTLSFLGPLYQFLKAFGLVGIGGVMVLALELMKKEDGTPMLSFKEEAKNMSWDALLLTAVVLLMSTQMSMPDTGIPAAISSLLMPFAQMPPMVFIILALVFAALITNVANNLVIACVIMPFMYNYANMIGMNPQGVVVLLFIMSQFALATPGASALTGICFAQTDFVKSADMTKYACLMLPFLIVSGLLFGLVYSSLLY